MKRMLPCLTPRSPKGYSFQGRYTRRIYEEEIGGNGHSQRSHLFINRKSGTTSAAFGRIPEEGSTFLAGRSQDGRSKSWTALYHRQLQHVCQDHLLEHGICARCSTKKIECIKGVRRTETLSPSKAFPGRSASSVCVGKEHHPACAGRYVCSDQAVIGWDFCQPVSVSVTCSDESFQLTRLPACRLFLPLLPKQTRTVQPGKNRTFSQPIKNTCAFIQSPRVCMIFA